MPTKDELETKLYEKMSQENEAFLAEMKTSQTEKRPRWRPASPTSLIPKRRSNSFSLLP